MHKPPVYAVRIVLGAVGTAMFVEIVRDPSDVHHDLMPVTSITAVTSASNHTGEIATSVIADTMLDLHRELPIVMRRKSQTQDRPARLRLAAPVHMQNEGTSYAGCMCAFYRYGGQHGRRQTTQRQIRPL
jgi:hypothetical protein